ncbi:MAG: M14-type cytosolic carboxypeptidase [Hyphomonadaceae bacterium]|nr:M14-type cytosolic carboxypeptidase [Hyphomonadaceae bacterium]
MSLSISSVFDSGNIIVNDASDPGNVRLEIAKDHQSDFYQWFHFRVTGEKGQALRLLIENAGGAAYPKGWENYQAVVSQDTMEWRRVPTSFDGQTLIIETELTADSIYVAYFAPYSSERHQMLVAGASNYEHARVSVLGKTLDGRDLDLITIGEPGPDKRTIWITARQHPGETMAEWWMEGFLERMLDPISAISRDLTARAVFYVVPNMNPDGSARGHLRTNAAGVNLNREWQAPSMEKSPEVFLTLEKMKETGCDLALDVHGDEALPYNFIAGTEGIPSWNDRLGNLLETFKSTYVKSSNGAFQTQFGYPKNAPGKANLTICSNALAERFDCLAMTLEMPFKDDANHPDPAFGWSPARAKQLGASALSPLLAVMSALR